LKSTEKVEGEVTKMEEKTIYLCRVSGGQYEDKWESIHLATNDEQVAKDWVKAQQQKEEERRNRYDLFLDKYNKGQPLTKDEEDYLDNTWFEDDTYYNYFKVSYIEKLKEGEEA